VDPTLDAAEKRTWGIRIPNRKSQQRPRCQWLTERETEGATTLVYEVLNVFPIASLSLPPTILFHREPSSTQQSLPLSLRDLKMSLSVTNSLPAAKRRNITTDDVWEDDDGNFILRQLSEEEQRKFDELDQLEKEFDGFRMGSTSTIKKKDRALQSFRTAMRFRYPRTGRILPSINEASLDGEILLNQPEDILIKYLIWWIQYWIQQKVTRGIRDTRPKTGTAVNMRHYITF
jgi:hypothetical protein